MIDNKETIEMLKMLKEQALKSHNDTAVLEVKIDSFNFVLDKAIKALEQQPCGDAVSREAVHSLMAILLSGYLHYTDRGKIELIDAKIAELPSVTPKEKTDWIPVSERLPEEHFCDDGFIEPSECVLIQMRSGCMKVSRYWGSRERYKDCPWIDMRYPTTDEVIAWMPLPTSYQGEENG